MKSADSAGSQQQSPDRLLQDALDKSALRMTDKTAMPDDNAPRLDQFLIADPSLQALFAEGRREEARDRAHALLLRAREAVARQTDGAPDLEAIATRMSDFGVAMASTGIAEDAIEVFKQALALHPANRRALHNTAATMLKLRRFHPANRRWLIEHCDSIERDAPWIAHYRPLLWAPTFLNLEYVKGKCNLKCRMCVGVNADAHPNKLTWLSPDDFRAAIRSAPIHSVTLSSGDSDPLLHPQFEEILTIAKENGVYIDLFTNGLPLSEKRGAAIVESGIVNTINFSIDAATSETYANIRGGDFDRVRQNLMMLARMKQEQDAPRPKISCSFVAMADNIEELPRFVEMAAEAGAYRVFVEDLLGWLTESHGNHPATDNPNWQHAVTQAQRAAMRFQGLELSLPVRLRDPSASAEQPADEHDIAGALAAKETDAAPAHEHRCCSWLNGVWVNEDGALHPCCMIRNVADMGSVADGPVYTNEKHNRTKEVLSSGKVFRACASKTMCAYVQQQKERGIPLRFITDEDLGIAAPVRSSDASVKVSLPVLSTV